MIFKENGPSIFNHHPTVTKKNMNLETTMFNLMFFRLEVAKNEKNWRKWQALKVGKWDKPEILLE